MGPDAITVSQLTASKQWKQWPQPVVYQQPDSSRKKQSHLYSGFRTSVTASAACYSTVTPGYPVPKWRETRRLAEVGFLLHTGQCFCCQQSQWQCTQRRLSVFQKYYTISFQIQTDKWQSHRLEILTTHLSSASVKKFRTPLSSRSSATSRHSGSIWGYMKTGSMAKTLIWE